MLLALDTLCPCVVGSIYAMSGASLPVSSLHSFPRNRSGPFIMLTMKPDA
jgi:hypothetical protein